MTSRRLIEAAFPLKQASLDSVHEKSVRHGHISTLHIWPARRPLAASRAALLATLLPDPASTEGRPADPASAKRAQRESLRRMAGRVVDKTDRDGEVTGQTTEGGILHWGRESAGAGGSRSGRASAGGRANGAPANVRARLHPLSRFRDEIKEAFDGRAPRVLDPFAGGGAIPLEAMRLGCEVVASDLNPVAWFILRCTLHYPHLLSGQKRALPEFALDDEAFMAAFFKAQGVAGFKAQGVAGQRALPEALDAVGNRRGGNSARQATGTGLLPMAVETQGDFAWHLRAWGRRALAEARRQLAGRYPTYAEFEPVPPSAKRSGTSPPPKAWEPRPPQLLTPNAQGEVSVASLNAEFSARYLADEGNPRWVAKPTVAYLWARTVPCAGCRQDVPLLKTRWLCRSHQRGSARGVPLARKSGKRVRLKMTAGANGVVFGVKSGVPVGRGSAARRRERDRVLGAGTMSSSGVTCPCCGVTATMADLRAAGRAGRLGERMTAVVVDGQRGKEYRLPTAAELEAADVREAALAKLFADIPFGLPEEPTPKAGVGASRAFSVDGYGFDTWRKLFTRRQLLALGTFVREIRGLDLDGYSDEWREATLAYAACTLSKLTDYSSTICSWHNGGEKLGHTFARFALPMLWDYCEVNPLSQASGGFAGMTEWVARYVDHALGAVNAAPPPSVRKESAIELALDDVDVICTDPPYYDAIPYSDLMDFFHVWLRRVLHGLSPETDAAFAAPLGPKWNQDAEDGELIDDAARFGGDRQASKRNYEDGMARAFARFHAALRDDGRLVIVFANKSPDAWETLVSALIRAGFVVDGSWPIQTEMQTRQRSLSSAALSSSIWLVCKKRAPSARPGWDNAVLREMQANITTQLRDFWDAGIRGPDFVWAATGPALEAFSKHPVVRRTDTPGSVLTVAEFLRHVRRMVVAFVVNRLFAVSGEATTLDDPTTYYLLHRNDFGLGDAPSGACILYALSCNVSDADLAGRLDILARGREAAPLDEDAEDEDDDAPPDTAPSGSKTRLKPWHRRTAKDLGEPTPDGSAPPLIDCVHRLMHLWKTGEQSRVDGYLEAQGLWRNDLFKQVVQAVLELAKQGTDERATLEYVQNHLAADGGVVVARQQTLLDA